MSEPLIDLDTLIRRPSITIDGRAYHLYSPDELTVRQARQFALWAQELDALQQGDEVDPALDTLIDTIARAAMVDVPDEVIERLSGQHKIAVVEVFIALLLRNRTNVAGAAATAMGNGLIGALLSPGSSASTAAPRPTGWIASLWRLCSRIWK